MRILLIKLSSLGDLIHSFPALQAARAQFPELRCDWVVEQGLAEVPALHPVVDRVISVNLRYYKKNKAAFWKENYFSTVKQQLRATPYDYVIDAQGLIKSGILTLMAGGNTAGLAWQSAREGWASLAYQHKYVVPMEHAILRVKNLFAQTLGYPADLTGAIDYGLPLVNVKNNQAGPVFLFHGTTWISKHWPAQHWKALAALLVQAGYPIALTWGNAVEEQRARWIVEGLEPEKVTLYPKGSLRTLYNALYTARAAIAGDTGLAHLAAALGLPQLSLFGPTDFARTGTRGLYQTHLQTQRACQPCLARVCRYQPDTALCMQDLTPMQVMGALEALLCSIA